MPHQLHACGMRWIGVAIVGFWLALFACAPAWSETHALLVGVSDYPGLPKARRLSGPRNDVLLLRDMMRASGMVDRQIHLLADGVDGAELPTRSRIMEKFSLLSRTVKAGDWVVVYLAGHGTQQPDGTGLEPDGLDEVFLPYDIGRWEKGMNSVRNSLVDKDIGAELGKLTARGARVWAIFDTCHAGDMAKSVAPNGKAQVLRRILPFELGITLPEEPPAAAASQQQAAMVKQRNDDVRKGRLVLFYASQPDEPAPEELESPGRESQKNNQSWHGVFSYRLAQAMKKQPRGSFAEWAKAVKLRYQEERRPFPHPYFVGELDQAPFPETVR
jgi:hypothetical protein